MKNFIALAAVSLCSSPVLAGPYVNVETKVTTLALIMSQDLQIYTLVTQITSAILLTIFKVARRLMLLMGLIQSLISLASLVAISLLQINLVSMGKYLSHKLKTLTTPTVQN